MNSQDKAYKTKKRKSYTVPTQRVKEKTKSETLSANYKKYSGLHVTATASLLT